MALKKKFYIREIDHPGLLQSSRPPSSCSPPTPPPHDGGKEYYSRPTTPLLPEPPSPRSMITGPPSQQSLPSIPPSPTSPISSPVHLSLVSNLSRSPPACHTQFCLAGRPPPTGPLPQLPSSAAAAHQLINTRMTPNPVMSSSCSPRTPPSLLSLRLVGEQWPLRDDRRFVEQGDNNMPKAAQHHTVWPCPEPSRQPPTTPAGTSSPPSSIRPESRKELPKKTGLSLWPAAQEPSRKPRNTTAVVSLSPNEARSESRGGGKGRMEPSSWLSSPSPSSQSLQQGSLGGEPGMDVSPCSTAGLSPPPRQRPYGWGGESLNSSPMSGEVNEKTEASASPRRPPHHRRGPCGVNPPTLSPSSPPSPSPRLGGETQTRMEPFQRLTSQAPPREGSLLGSREPIMDPSPSWLPASPTPGGPRPLGEEPSMEPSQRLTSQSPRAHGPLGREPRMEPSPWQQVSSPPRPKPLGGEPPMETSPQLTSQHPRQLQEPLGREPRTEPSARPTNPSPPRPSSSPRQGPLGVGELSRTEHDPSASRPSNDRERPHEWDLTTSRTPLNHHEPRRTVTEPPTRLTGPSCSPPCGRGPPVGGKLRASSSTYASSRPGLGLGMEPAPLLPPRSTLCSEESHVFRQSPIISKSHTSLKVENAAHNNNTVVTSSQPPPPPPVTTYPPPYPYSYYAQHPAPPPGSSSGPAAAPHGPSHTHTHGTGPAPPLPPLPLLPDIIEARDESVLLYFPMTYHLALACAEDKHSSEMAESEQQLEYLKLKTKLYEDFFLALEAGRSSSSSVLGRRGGGCGGGGGRREPRGRPRSLGELKFRLESQMRVMKAEQTRISKGSGWF